MKRWRWIGVMAGVVLSAQAIAFAGDPQRGNRIYEQRCIMCHGPDGRGNDGMGADFRTEWYRLTKSDEELARNLRNGLQTPGKTYKAGRMPPQMLSERDLADVLAYLRQAFLQ